MRRKNLGIRKKAEKHYNGGKPGWGKLRKRGGGGKIPE